MSEEMTRKGAIEYLINWDKALESQGDSPFSDARRALSYGIHSLETDEAYQLEYERTTKNDLGVDCISRKAVIDELKRYFHDEYYQRTSIQDCRDCFIEDVLNHLPSVTPQEPRKGHWIMTRDYLTTAYGSIDYVKCSCCGEDSLEEGNYCPNCGADMRTSEE